MKITVHGGKDMARALEAWPVPEACDELTIDAPQARRFTNCLLNSPINCRVTVVPTENDAVSYAGLFSGCRLLQHQPVVDVSKCINMAAFFKECREARFNLYQFRQTANVRDMRQCLMGCVNLAGNGLQEWDFSGLSSEDAMRNFAHGTTFRTECYDGLIKNLFRQAKVGTLPTPMHAVDFGSARYSPLVSEKRQFLIDYGWDIKDGGRVHIDLSDTEKGYSKSVDDAIKAHGDQWLSAIDCSPVAKSSRNGTLVTPRHTIHVSHYAPHIGHVVRFWRGETATVTAVARHPSSDLCIATLDRDMDIRPAKLLPRSWRNELPNSDGPPTRYPAGSAPPLILFSDGNSSQPPGLMDLSFVAASTSTGVPQYCSGGARAMYPPSIQVGDSGSSVCFLDGDRLVLAWPLQSGGGTGPWLANHLDWIDEASEYRREDNDK
jgi:hypothetical protein